jgi:Flp pilus assembly pilin Flp
MHVMDILSRVAFGFASAVLMVMAAALVIYGVYDLIAALRGPWSRVGDAMLTAIGYQVIAMAVFDVAKYFIEEEVIRGRELRIASEARRSLTKFISTIAIAVFHRRPGHRIPGEQAGRVEHGLSDRPPRCRDPHRSRSRRLPAAQRRG